METWLLTNRKVPFPRNVNDALRDIGGTSAYELQEFIASALATPNTKKSKPQIAAIKQYLTILKECEMSVAEDIADTTTGGMFILKASHGYEDKQTVRVEDGNLADIIAAKTSHKS